MAKSVLPSAVRPPPDGDNSSNRLLSSLPTDDYQRVLRDIEIIPTKPKQVLHKHAEPVRHVYFPNGGVCSITTVMRDGAMVEVATVGDEGMVGITAFLGADITPGPAMVQVGNSSAGRMTTATFKREIDRGGALADALGRYSQALMATMMQSVACNTLHHVQERCARWLLTTHDRMHSDQFELSHEFLAIMLGVRRPTVTIVAGGLQREGLIRYRHGRITILDRKGLEKASCECYATIRGHFARLRL